jgi:hypothetical protein
VFVAGRAVLEAYHFEQQQDWVGIMLAPSAVQSTPELGSYWFRLTSRFFPFEEIEPHISWAASIQWRATIPFHTERPFDDYSGFAGYALIPHSGVLQPSSLCDSLKAVIERLKWLQMIAPTPAAQKKYSHTVHFLENIQDTWGQYARMQELQRQQG